MVKTASPLIRSIILSPAASGKRPRFLSITYVRTRSPTPIPTPPRVPPVPETRFLKSAPIRGASPFGGVPDDEGLKE